MRLDSRNVYGLERQWRKEAGKKIFAAREAKGWSQQKVADELGIKRARYGHWETGLSWPNKIEAQRLMDLLDIDPQNMVRSDSETQLPDGSSPVEINQEILSDDNRCIAMRYCILLAKESAYNFWRAMIYLMSPEQVKAVFTAILSLDIGRSTLENVYAEHLEKTNPKAYSYFRRVIMEEWYRKNGY